MRQLYSNKGDGIELTEGDSTRTIAALLHCCSLAHDTA